ncbi:MAG: sulfite exporter TauE/SafE family protein [Desulfovibrio sp.]|nr:sulfite exporter TauE/SafE family protein [Desulfovibrio sp.]
MFTIILYTVSMLVGFLVGITGVGGILIPPALILFSGQEVHMAMGTALASFMPVGLVGTIMYRRLGHIDWRKALPYMAGSLAAWPGAMLNGMLPAGPLVALLSCIIIFSGLCALRPPKPGNGSVFWQSGMGFFCIGAVTALLAGLTGAGGPVVSIPWMIIVGVPPMVAVGLAMPYQVTTAFFGTIGNVAEGHVDFTILPYICLMALAGLLAGVAVARRIPTGMLRKLIGGLCCGLGLFLLLRLILS